MEILKVAQTEASAAQVSLLTVLNVYVDRKGWMQLSLHLTLVLYKIQFMLRSDSRFLLSISFPASLIRYVQPHGVLSNTYTYTLPLHSSLHSRSNEPPF